VLIDWFTVGAQLLNFLILVWLMKRFLYQPVLDAIAAREQKIAAELADAATARPRRRSSRTSSSRRTRPSTNSAPTCCARPGRREGRTRAPAAEAREAADATSAALAKALLSDAQHLRADMTRHTQDQVFDISRRVLGDLASVSLEQRACEVFIERLRAVDGPARDTLGEALKAASSAEPALLRSAFDCRQRSRRRSRRRWTNPSGSRSR
jgi:F-type H+-transporting ATPase subunit b